MRLHELDTGKTIDFTPESRLGAGCNKKVIEGVMMQGKTAMRAALALYAPHRQEHGLAETIAQKHAALQAANIPTWEWVQAVRDTRGRVGVLLPLLRDDHSRILSVSDIDDPNLEIGPLEVGNEDRKRLLSQIADISHRATNAGIRIPHDSPFFRIRMRKGVYRLEDMMIGDIDDVEPDTTVSHLQRINDRALYGSLDDLLRKFAPDAESVYSWM